MNATAFMTRRPKKIKNRAASSSATRKMGVASPLGSRLEGMLSGGLVMLQRVTRTRLTVERSPLMEFQSRATWFCNRRVLPDPISLETVFAEACYSSRHLCTEKFGLLYVSAPRRRVLLYVIERARGGIRTHDPKVAARDKLHSLVC